MSYTKIQQRFTVGELDPKMLGRADIEQYYSAAETLTNVICLPQGGFRRRKGTRFLQRIKNVSTRKTTDITITCPNGGTTSNANDGNNSSLVTTTGAIGTTADYVVVEYEFAAPVTNGAYIDINNIYLSTGSSTGEIFQVQYLTGSSWTKIGEFDLTTTSRTFRFRVPDFISMSKIRVIKTTSQDLSTAVVNLGELNIYVEGDTLSNARLVDFAFSVEQTYMLVLSNENIDIYENKVYLVSIKATDLTSARLSAINWTQSSDSLLIVHPDFYPKILVRNSAYDKIWTYSNITFSYIPKYDFVPTTSTPSATLTPSATSGVVTLTAGSSVFTSGDVGQIIDGGGGRARIIEYTSGTVVKVVTLIPFYGTSAIASGSWTVQGGFVDAWSATYGYPVSVVFFENRLVFGGSKSLPTYIWMSVVDDYFNFDEGSLYDDEAIVRNIQDSQLNAIKQVFVQKTLQIFTTGAEFVSVQSLNDPITPTNIQIKRQTNSGIEGNLRVFEHEGRTLFIQRNGSNVISLIYNDLEQGYNNPSISIFSSHLIENPVDVCLRTSSSTDESSLYLLVRNDGGISVGTLYLSQKVGAFSNLTTDGLYKNVGIDNQDIYVVVNRTINSVSHNYLEIFDENVACDCCYYATGAVNAAVSGLNFLEAKSVQIVSDGSQLSNETVSSGSITMDRASTTTLFIGLPFNPYVKTLSVEIPSLGSLLGKKKRIVDLYLRLYETSDIIVNVNNRVAFRGFGTGSGDSPLDVPPPSYTGIKNVPCLLGWGYDGSIVITQDTPFEMNVLALEMKVKI